MFGTIFLIIVQWIVKIMFCVALFVLASIVGLKLWLGPVKIKCKSDVRLNGKLALITGGNSGIGLETARDLARRGATVIIASRDVKKSEEAVTEIRETTGNQDVHHKYLDLAKFSSIQEFAEDFNGTYDRLDVLVNNAGCAGLLPSLTEDGIEKVTQINYVGPFLLTNLLLDKLTASKPSRIVIVSSKANEFHDFNPDDIANVKRQFKGHQVEFFRIYANTKLCNILWAKALAKRLPDGVTVNALHPGVVMTNIFHKLPEFTRKGVLWLVSSFFKTAEEGAQTSIYLCVAPEVEGITGEYFAECEITRADKLTMDDKMVERVWENTMALIREK